MKYFFFFMTIIGFSFACNPKDNPKPSLPDDYWGEASAEKNNELWTANPTCWIDLIDKKSINVELDSFYGGYYLAESLIIRPIPPVPGTYNVHKFELNTTKLYSNYTFWDYDVPLGEYNIIESDSTNQITIASYDTLSKEIKGTFNLRYVVQKRPYPNTPDTILFKNGQFHGKIIKK